MKTTVIDSLAVIKSNGQRHTVTSENNSRKKYQIYSK